MTEQEMLVLLKVRTTAVQFRTHRVDRLVERDGGDPGLFVPTGRHPTTIYLKRGRPTRRTLFTLCHELGHFWSYASGRRTKTYEQALWHHQKWHGEMELRFRNLLFEKGINSPAEALPATFDETLADAKSQKPCPVSEPDRTEILSEEIRAWCFGFSLALALGADGQAFAEEADAALGWYYSRLDLDRTEWTPEGCPGEHSEEDEAFILDLTSRSP